MVTSQKLISTRVTSKQKRGLAKPPTTKTKDLQTKQKIYKAEHPADPENNMTQDHRI